MPSYHLSRVIFGLVLIVVAIGLVACSEEDTPTVAPPTSTRVAPTNTATAVSTDTPTPTPTLIPATPTPAVTATPISPTPTPTQVPLMNDVSFQNDPVTLAGTLTLPATEGPHPAIVLISGSGPQNRDNDIFGFKIFERISDALTENGVAVLRYDDRGVGQSGGNLFNSTLQDYAGDVLSAIELLKARSDIDSEQIGLLGHSEGGYVASIAHSQSDDVAFIVLMAGPGISGEALLKLQGEVILRANGGTEELIRENAVVQQMIFDAVKMDEGWDEVEVRLREQAASLYDSVPEAQRAALGSKDQFINNFVLGQFQSARNPWFKSFLEYDPAPDMEMMTVPVLALFGELDLNVPAQENAEGITMAMETAGNQDFTAFTFPEASHLFQKAVLGTPNEWPALAKEFVPGFLEMITEWVAGRVE